MSKVQLAGNASGTGIFQIASPNSNTDRTLTLPDTTGTLVTNTSGSVSQSMLASNVAGTGPAFFAYPTATLSVTQVVYTKVTLDAEIFDTNSNFSSSRFTPTVAGYYQLNAQATLNNNTNNIGLVVLIYKNGNAFSAGVSQGNSSIYPQAATSTLVYMNGSTDYVEMYVYTNNSNVIGSNYTSTQFSGALVRSA